jgi:uncharacterized protein YcbK (DUF882 family)
MARSSIAVALLLALGLSASSSSAKPKRAPPKKHAMTGAAYKTHVNKWHEKEPGAKAPVNAQGRPKLVLEAINLRERVELEPEGAYGGFSETEQTRAASILRDSRGDREHPVEPGLLDLLYKIQLHFDAPSIRIISGYRTQHGARASQHTLGHAADIVVPGAQDQAVAAYARTLGTTGVGLYPTSGFVHVDVRGSSHYWVDSSGPGAKSKPAKRVASKSKHKPKPKKPARKK